jgi:hypothetical protein
MYLVEKVSLVILLGMEEKPVTQPLKFGPTFRSMFMYIRFHDTTCPHAFN